MCAGCQHNTVSELGPWLVRWQAKSSVDAYAQNGCSTTGNLTSLIGETVPTYTRETRLTVAEDVAYAYLSKASNLPTYFPRITEVRQTDGDAVQTTAVIDPPGEAEQTVHGTAWFHTDESSKKVTWGAKGPHDYHGELDFDSDGDQACTLTFTLHTESDHPGIDGSIDETLDRIRHKLTEQPSVTDHPTGAAQADENAELESPA